MTAPEIPQTMKKLVVVEGGASIKDCKIEFIEVDVPQPKSGELLVKMAAAVVNPSDYGKWTNPSQENQAMGLEGSGVVVASGGGIMTWKVSIGQKVGVINLKNNQGTYSEYVTVSATDGYFPLPDDLPVEDAAGFFVNPYTVLGILDTAAQAHSKALVHTAAASQLGQMMNKLANDAELSNGMEIINVVRREEQAKILEDLGAKHIINTSHDDWKTQLKAKMKELECTVAFDAVAGSMAGDLLECLPPKGQLFVYGVLAGKISGVDPLDLIYRQKKLKGFFLTSWIKGGGLLSMLSRMSSAGKTVNAGLKQGGWSSSQFKDVSMEDMHKECVALLEGSATGAKLRVRLDQ
jgi:NADPH:quinone reductase-like Zn-dependent oxidoreductase